MVTWATINRELELIDSGVEYIVGVDEVGAGCLAGPVVACAVAFNKKFFLEDEWRNYAPRDSKKLSEKQREKFYKDISHSQNFHFVIAESSPKRIDDINILNATHEAICEASIRLPIDFSKAHALIDGNKKIKNLNISQTCLVGGDATTYSIAFASIMAKVTRDNMMSDIDKIYPEYGFAKHKGYGTKDHFKKIAEHGICPLHRRSFLKSV